MKTTIEEPLGRDALELLKGVRALCDNKVEPGESVPVLVRDAVVVALGVCEDVAAVARAADMTDAEVKACVGRKTGERGANVVWVRLAASLALRHRVMLAGTIRSAMEGGADLDRVADAADMTIREIIDLLDAPI